MSDYQVGTDEWLFDLYNQFLSANNQPFLSGSFPEDWALEDFSDTSGGNIFYNVADDFLPSIDDWMNAQESGINPLIASMNFSSLSDTERVQWNDPQLPGYNTGYYGIFGEPLDNAHFLLNLNQWLADWGSNIPDYDPLDKQNALSIGRLKKRDNVWDILKNVNQAGSGMNKYINRPDSGKLQYLYDSALATGILSDFQTRSEIWDMEQDYISDVYSMLGETSAAGGFDWGDLNMGDYYASTVAPGGASVTDETSSYCAGLCGTACSGDQINSSECEECLNSCFETGNV